MSEYVLVEEIPKIADYEIYIADINQPMPDPNDKSLWTEVQGLESMVLENEGQDITVYYLGRGGARTVYNVELNPSIVITGVKTRNDPGQQLLHAVGKVFGTGNARKWWVLAIFDEDKIYGKFTAVPYGLGGGAANEIPRLNLTFNSDGVPVHVKIGIFQYNIAYNGLLAGDVNPNPLGFNDEDIPVTLQDVTRDSATFDGWYDAETGGNKITTISSTGDKALWARFA